MMNRIISITEQLMRDLRKDQANEQAHPPKILVVEDDPNDAHLMQLTLKRIGCVADIAPTAEAAIELLNKASNPTLPDYSIIFLDLKLPGKDGVEVLKTVRQVQAHIPVVIVTGSVYNSPLLTEAVRLGYFGLVQKPLNTKNMDEIFDKHKIAKPTTPPTDPAALI